MCRNNRQSTTIFTKFGFEKKYYDYRLFCFIICKYSSLFCFLQHVRLLGSRDKGRKILTSLGRRLLWQMQPSIHCNHSCSLRCGKSTLCSKLKPSFHWHSLLPLSLISATLLCLKVGVPFVHEDRSASCNQAVRLKAYRISLRRFHGCFPRSALLTKSFLKIPSMCTN